MNSYKASLFYFIYTKNPTTNTSIWKKKLTSQNIVVAEIFIFCCKNTKLRRTHK